MIITVASMETKSTDWGDKLFITDTEGKKWALSNKKQPIWKEFEEGYQTEVTLKKSSSGTEYIDTAKKLVNAPVNTDAKPVVKQASVDMDKVRGVALRYAVDYVIGKIIPVSDVYMMASLNEQYLVGNIQFDTKDILAYQIKLQNSKPLFEES